MTYQALARKWRPKRFDEIVGQPHVVKSLSHALTKNTLHHAYLFTGTHGIGKTTLARIFAKCLNCEIGVTDTPCEQCSHCLEINNGRFPDLYEIDAASRTKVEDTRELLDNIPYAPTKGRFKVYLIDEVHMLSGHSFNALLKTLEEPPPHVKFLLATTDPQKLPATVLSRCLQFHLSKMTAEQTDKQLAAILTAEHIPFETDALSLISHAANGSMRDALTLLDQCIAYGNGTIQTNEIRALLGLSAQTEITHLLNAIHTNDANTALALTKQWADNGIHFARCLSDMLTQLYQLSVMQSVEHITFSTAAPELKNYATQFPPENVQLYYQIALIGQRDLPLAPTPQIGFEMVVMRMMTFTPNTLTPKNTTQKIAPTEKKENKESDEKNNNALANKTDWHLILPELNLSGPTLALAQHCSMQSLTSETLLLYLQPKFGALLTTRLQQRMQDAVMLYFNRPLKLMITIADNQSETPATLAVRAEETRKKTAIQSISEDPSIQRIVKTFDATVIADSIEPLKYN